MDTITTFEEACHIQNDYVCARCYGFLMTFPAEDKRNAVIKCTNVDCDGAGFVTKAYADKRRSDSHFEAMDARQNLREFFPNPHKGKTPEQILKEMGF